MALDFKRGPDGPVEQEMSAHQRGLVDMCLEEGQFESAIAVLEQLRSPNYRPATSHIRQLIYMALQPEHPPDPDTMTDIPSSPSKTLFKKRVPSGKAVSAARRLLRSFAITNSPDSIACALPCYDDPKKGQPIIDDGSLESVIGPDSMGIAQAKSCWHIISEGFTLRGQSSPTTLEKGPKRIYGFDREDDLTTASDFEYSVVGKDSWSVLDWLLILFERDENMADARNLSRHSNLLLQQIPHPRGGNGPRWDAEIPLRIVFYCLEQPDLRHQLLGFRLMMLLINLSSIGYLDASMFAASVYSHLTVAGLEKLPILFSGMKASLATHQFKLMVCYKLLTDSTAQPKLRNRVQPRALYQKQASSVQRESISTQPLKTNSSTKPVLPRFAEIWQSLENNAAAPSVAIAAVFLPRIKFELLNSYYLLQSEIPLAARDVDWLASLGDGRVTQILDLVFKEGDKDGESAVFRDILSRRLVYPAIAN